MRTIITIAIVATLSSCEPVKCLVCQGHTTIELCEDEVAFPDLQLEATREQLEASGYTCNYRSK